MFYYSSRDVKNIREKPIGNIIPNNINIEAVEYFYFEGDDYSGEVGKLNIQIIVSEN